MMPEGLVKISSSLYETILPMVKQQVETQIKVRDMSRTQVSIAPAEFASWSDARAELMSEAKAGLKSRLEAELGAAGSESDLAAIKATFSADERALEQEIDNTVHTFSCKLNLDYSASPMPPQCTTPTLTAPPACAQTSSLSKELRGSVACP